MTNTIKYGLVVLGLLIILFLTNQRSQNSYNIEGEPIYTGSDDNIRRILITEADKMLELVKSDTTWDITQADSFEVKENQVEKIIDRLLKVEQEMLISSKPEKWSKFGVDDSLGKHLKLFDDSEKELVHYVFGNSGQDYQHNYVRANNSSDVYRTNDNVYFLLNSNVNYWGSKPKKEEPTTDDKELDTN